TLSVDYIPFFDPKHPEESLQRSVKVLQEHLKRYPNQHALMCFEFVQGEAGFHTGSPAFFKALLNVLKEHEILVLADEVQTFGRTYELFAYQYFGLAEWIDIVSLGKMSQVCATLFRNHMKPKPGLLSQTFTGSTCALKASCWVVQHLLSDNFFGNGGK